MCFALQQGGSLWIMLSITKSVWIILSMTARLGIILEVAGSICLSGVSAYLTYPTLFCSPRRGEYYLWQWRWADCFGARRSGNFPGNETVWTIVKHNTNRMITSIRISIHKKYCNIPMSPHHHDHHLNGPSFLASGFPWSPLSSRSWILMNCNYLSCIDMNGNEM